MWLTEEKKTLQKPSTQAKRLTEPPKSGARRLSSPHLFDFEIYADSYLY